MCLMLLVRVGLASKVSTPARARRVMMSATPKERHKMASRRGGSLRLKLMLGHGRERRDIAWSKTGIGRIVLSMARLGMA